MTRTGDNDQPVGSPTFGLIEAGGTKFVVGVARGGELGASTRIETRDPDDTLAAVIGWLSAQAQAVGHFDGIGIASFGPLDLDPASATWGHINRTPKQGWSGTDIAGRLGRAFHCPVAIDTDVGAAALAEYRWGAAQGQKSAVYLTVGTGIGGGAVINGAILRGLSHPEMGHFRPVRHPDDHYEGCCRFHADCLEGLASGPAIIARWGKPLSELGPEHPGHAITAHYLAQAVNTLQAMFEPGCIILGGGVMATPGLIEKVRTVATAAGNGYFLGDAREIVRSPVLGNQAGLMGALALAGEL